MTNLDRPLTLRDLARIVAALDGDAERFVKLGAHQSGHERGQAAVMVSNAMRVVLDGDEQGTEGKGG